MTEPVKMYTKLDFVKVKKQKDDYEKDKSDKTKPDEDKVKKPKCDEKVDGKQYEGIEYGPYGLVPMLIDLSDEIALEHLTTEEAKALAVEHASESADPMV